MKGKQIVAIDVGSSNVVIAVGAVEEDGRVDILGIVSEPVEGVNAGRVENNETVGAAVKRAKERIEERLNIKITEAYAGLSGDYVRCVQVNDHVYVQDELGNGCNQITERDLEDLAHFDQLVKLGDCRIVFPFGDGLARNPKLLGKSRLRQIVFCAMLINVFSEIHKPS